MSRTIRLPARFKTWTDYEDTYGVDVLLDVNVMRCRQCRREWGIEHNRGKMLQRMHRCPGGCNGRPRQTNRYVGRPTIDRPLTLAELQAFVDPLTAQELVEQSHAERAAEADERRQRGRQRRLPAKLWHDLRVRPEVWASVNRMFDEAAMQPDPLAYVAQEGARLRKVDRGRP